MATESVSLSMEDVRRIQDRLLVGMAAFAEIDRVRDHLDLELPDNRFAAERLRGIGAFPLRPAVGDDEYGEFIAALHILHIASSP